MRAKNAPVPDKIRSRCSRIHLTASVGALPFGAGMMRGTPFLLFAGRATGAKLTINVHALRLAGATTAVCGFVLAIHSL